MDVSGINPGGDIIDQMVALTKVKEETESMVKVKQTQQKINDALLKIIQEHRDDGTYA